VTSPLRTVVASPRFHRRSGRPDQPDSVPLPARL